MKINGFLMSRGHYVVCAYVSLKITTFVTKGINYLVSTKYLWYFKLKVHMLLHVHCQEINSINKLCIYIFLCIRYF